MSWFLLKTFLTERAECLNMFRDMIMRQAVLFLMLIFPISISGLMRLLIGIDFGENCYDVNFDRIAADEDLADIIRDIGEHNGIWGSRIPNL